MIEQHRPFGPTGSALSPRSWADFRSWRSFPFPARGEGFTLIEVAIVIVLLGLVLGSATTLLFRSEIFSADFTREGVIEETGWRITARLGEEMYTADVGSLLPAVIDNSAYVEFREILGYTAGAPVLGNTIIIGWQPAAGEVLNGGDDNGDGRIDEGFVTRLDTGDTAVVGTYPLWGNYPDGTLVQLAGNVLGLRFNTTVGGISYSVNIGLVDKDGNLTQDTFTGQIAFRNS